MAQVIGLIHAFLLRAIILPSRERQYNGITLMTFRIILSLPVLKTTVIMQQNDK
jgi:hypothetical protein